MNKEFSLFVCVSELIGHFLFLSGQEDFAGFYIAGYFNVSRANITAASALNAGTYIIVLG